MTLSWTKIHIACSLLAISANAFAAEPLDSRMAAAEAAIGRAERLPMRGNSAEMLDEARQRWSAARELALARKGKDALQQANEAEAAAELAIARFRYNLLRFEIESKTSRNTQLRRRIYLQPEGNGR